MSWWFAREIGIGASIGVGILIAGIYGLSIYAGAREVWRWWHTKSIENRQQR
jgi:hypothetical protein